MVDQYLQSSSTEIQFSRSWDAAHLGVVTLSDGSVTVVIEDTTGGRSYELTMAQAIQLRDFLNRHIDELALKQTGSQAVRSSDDPNQLAAVEELPVSIEGCGRAMFGNPLNMVRCGDSRTARCTSCGGIFAPQDDE